MADIIHRMGIRSSPDDVYRAITTVAGLRNWWTQDVKGDESVGGALEFTFRNTLGDLLGEMSMHVTALNENQNVQWKCTAGPDEWIDTDITFDLSQQDDQVILLFGHRHWKEPVEFMAHCSMKWAVFLLSLRDYIEKGKGHPSPHDVKIDNWN